MPYDASLWLTEEIKKVRHRSVLSDHLFIVEEVLMLVVYPSLLAVTTWLPTLLGSPS
jgi:hypothetical protein